MGRGALSRGGLAAVLIAAAVYVLLGGDIDLGGGTDTGGTPSREAPSEPAPQRPAPDAPAPNAGVSEQEGEEIARVLALVDAGGPFAHDQDGTTFSNREGLLPDQPEGYYKEYTCETPGSDDRGARRLVIGAGGETYYTADHYSSFTQIDPEDYP